MIFVSRLQFSYKYLIVAATLGLAAPALAADPKHLGDNGNWSAYAHQTKAGKICFAITEPKDKLPKKVNRDPVYFLVTNRPKDKIRNEVSIITGYPYKSSSTTTARIGDDVFKMYTKGDGAWIDNNATEKLLIQAMKNGSSMTVKGTSKRGTVTTDKYSLLGFTKTMSSIDKSCK